MRGDAGTAAGDSDLLAVGDVEAFGVVGVDFEVALFGVEFTKDFGFSGAGLGVPLAAGATAGQEDEGEFVVGGFGEGGGVVEEEFGFATRVIVFFLLKEAALVEGLRF